MILGGCLGSLGLVKFGELSVILQLEFEGKNQLMDMKNFKKSYKTSVFELQNDRC